MSCIFVSFDDNRSRRSDGYVPSDVSYLRDHKGCALDHLTGFRYEGDPVTYERNVGIGMLSIVDSRGGVADTALPMSISRSTGL